MASNLKWHGEAIKKKFDAELGKRIWAAADLVKGHARRLVSVEGTTGVYRTIKRGKNAGKQRKVKTIYNTNPSQPGEPPHKQKGWLRTHINRERVGLVARVGPDTKKPPYPRYLELGTKKMAARPWLRRAFNEKLAEIRALLSRPLK